jgi:hypothetical protein
MEILGHLINDAEIIGIGPLYAKPHPENNMRLLYNSFRYEFEIHARHRSIQIHSDYFNPDQGNGVNNGKEKTKYEKWEEDYRLARSKVAEHIGEMVSKEK